MRASSCTRALRTLSHPARVNLEGGRYKPRCSFSSSSSLRDGEAGEDAAFKKSTRAKVDPQTVEDWFQGEGLPYLNPTPGKPNWLGGDVPFPDNPTFRPPPPLSDIVKSSVYDRYLKRSQASALPKSQSHVQAVRALSEQFGISISRVEAIVRLKQYEEHFIKGNKIQHAFQKGMESYLGIRQERERAAVSNDNVTSDEINASRQRTSQVDHDASDSGERVQRAGAARRVWWEMVDDAPDAEPVVPNLVAKGLEAHRARLTENQKAHEGVAVHVEGKPSPQGKPRTVYTFVDTGAKVSRLPKKTHA
ncbi:hypothetical protein RhiJN_11453 [Ceratobasidium sp. AG-Ba]|nr:hypothetical protein RhiJN_11453 [Ceratobasidium sp. AG-Ba]